MKLVTCLLLLLLLAGTGLAQTMPRSKTVLVRGTATRDLTPETAELLLTYRITDNVRDADRAREQQTRLLAVLREYGIAPEKLVVYNLSASGYGFTKSTNSTVSLVKQYKLTLDKPALLDELLPKLVQSGADAVVVSNLLSSRLEAFRLEVISLALANARTKAQHVAQLSGLKLLGANTVQEVGATSPTRLERAEDFIKMRGASAMDEQSQGAENSSVSPRLIRVSAAFDVAYDVQ